MPGRLLENWIGWIESKLLKQAPSDSPIPIDAGVWVRSQTIDFGIDGAPISVAETMRGALYVRQSAHRSNASCGMFLMHVSPYIARKPVYEFVAKVSR